jgi:hypothetical protein
VTDCHLESLSAGGSGSTLNNTHGKSSYTYDKPPAIPTEIVFDHHYLQRYFTLISTDEATKIELKQLYKLRWHVELDLRNIKTTLGMAQSAKLADLLPRQLSFKHCLRLWQPYRELCGEIGKDLDILCRLSSEYRRKKTGKNRAEGEQEKTQAVQSSHCPERWGARIDSEKWPPEEAKIAAKNAYISGAFA